MQMTMPNRTTPINRDYGRDCFIRKDGQRLRVRMVRTLEPSEAESNADFERRMDLLAEQLEQMDGFQGIAYEFERRDGAIVLCTLDVQHEPRPVAVVEDPRPAGGRSGNPRGQRGRGNRNN
jgi:hypothetical protein